MRNYETTLNGVRGIISHRRCGGLGVLQCGTLSPIRTVQNLNHMHCRHKVRGLCISRPTMESGGASYILGASGGSCRRSECLRWVT